MDKVIREIQGANGVLTCGQRVLFKLDFRPNNSVGREREKKRKEKGREAEILEREKLHLLSRFLDDRTDGSRWIKKKSASPRKEFLVETRNGEFRQTPRGRSSPTSVILYPKGCVVVSCPKGDVWLHFEPREATLF